MEKVKPSIYRIRCSKKPKNYVETWAQRIQRPENPLSMAEVEPYWKSLWGEEAQHDVRAEWGREGKGREGKGEGILIIWIGSHTGCGNRLISVKCSQLNIS